MLLEGTRMGGKTREHAYAEAATSFPDNQRSLFWAVLQNLCITATVWSL